MKALLGSGFSAHDHSGPGSVYLHLWDGKTSTFSWARAAPACESTSNVLTPSNAVVRMYESIWWTPIVQVGPRAVTAVTIAYGRPCSSSGFADLPNVRGLRRRPAT